MKNLLLIPMMGLAFLCHCQTIIDINFNNTGSDASNLTVFANKVFFSADDGVSGMGIYSMDNNSSPVRLSPGLFIDPGEFTVLDDRLYFTSGPFQSRQLYCIESSNTNLIIDIDNSTGNPAEMISHNGVHYFVNGDEILMITPNTYDAFSIASINGISISNGMPNSTDMDRKYIFVASDKLFFNSTSGIYYVDLLLFNGAELVTNSDNYEYEPGPPGGGDYAGYFVGDKVVYRNIGIGVDSELILIDAASSTPTANFINLSSATSSRPTFFIENQGILYFTAFNDTDNMNVVWYMDGSESTIADFSFISGVLSAQTIFSGASNDPFISVDNDLFHFRKKISVVGGIPTISQEECFDYPYFNHQVISYGGDYYYIGCCFDLFRCNGNTTEKLTCVGGIDNAIGKFVLLDDKIYFSSPIAPNYAVELLRWPEDQGDGICQDDCMNDMVGPNCDGNSFTVQLDPGQNYYTFDINDFASDECSPILTYENASLDPSTPNGTTTHFWSGNEDQFACGTYIITSSFPFDDAGNFSDCAFTFTVECSMDICTNSMHFDGINDRIVAPSPLSGNSNYSISIDFKCGPQSNGPFNRLLGFSGFETEIAINGTNLAYYNGTGWVDNPILNVADNIWHNVTLTKESNENILYLDGNVISILPSPTLAFTGEVIIGHKQNNGSNEYFKGEIDNVKIWDVTLDSAEVCKNIIADDFPNVLYYNFEEGEGGQDNTSISGPIDLAGGDHNGVFGGFTLIENTSNYLCTDYNINCVNECLNDTIHPNCITQNINVSLDPAGQASITPEMIDNGSNDECSEVTLTLLGNAAFICRDVGTNDISLIVIDAAGNQDTCTAIITIEDKTPPMVGCPVHPINYVLPISGTINTSISDYNLIIDEACKYSVEGITILNCDDLNANPTVITVTVTDANDNSTSCQVSLTVSDPAGYCECLDDITPPIINCLNQVIEFPLTSIGSVDVTLSNIVTATDDCGGVTVTGGSGVFTCVHVSNVPQYYTMTASNDAGLQTTCLQGFVITDPNGYCTPYSCPDVECPTNVIDLSTGLDNHNNMLDVGQYVGNWQLIDGPDQGLNYPLPGFVLNPNVVWDQLPGSQYISPFANASNNQSFSEPYLFERCFCVCQPDATVQLDIAAYVDNFINIGLYDDQDNTIQADLINYQSPAHASTFLAPAFISNTSHQLSAGTYCLRAGLRNDGSVTMGMAINAVVTGAGFIESKCCLPYSIITGTVFNDVQCDTLNNYNQDEGIENIEVYLSDTNGNLISTVTTDPLGYYVFNDVPMGDVIVTQEPIPNNTMSLGYNGYQLTVIDNNVIGDIDFGNCIVQDVCCATSEELTNEVVRSLNSTIFIFNENGVTITFPDMFECQYVSKVIWGDGEVQNFTAQDIEATHYYQSNGAYTLSIEVTAILDDVIICQTDIVDNCIIMNDCETSTTWSEEANYKFKVYPIPFNESFIIDMSNNTNGYTLSIYNVLGQLANSIEIDKNTLLYSYNGSSLSTGTYLLRLEDKISNIKLESRIIKVD